MLTQLLTSGGILNRSQDRAWSSNRVLTKYLSGTKSHHTYCTSSATTCCFIISFPTLCAIIYPTYSKPSSTPAQQLVDAIALSWLETVQCSCAINACPRQVKEKQPGRSWSGANNVCCGWTLGLVEASSWSRIPAKSWTSSLSERKLIKLDNTGSEVKPIIYLGKNNHTNSLP